MANLTKAYNWCISTCNAPNVGYSQAYRNAQTVDGITYYDCSSFIYYALKEGGFNVTENYGTNPFVTADMRSVLIALGFEKMSVNTTWKAGDIVWKTGHCEMVYSGYVTMGAHTDGVQLADQVSISDGAIDPDYYEELYRYTGQSVNINVSWITGGNSEYFTKEQMENNALCIFNFFSQRGWTVEAIAGLCGNIQQESTFNPALIEIGGTGHGLVQWTPPSNLYDVLDVLYGSHSDWSSGEKQCNVIYAEYEEATGLKDRGIEKQWYETAAYPMSWKEWATSTQDPGELALIFQANYERPAALHPERSEYARNWYEFFQNVEYDPVIPDYKKKKKKGYNFILFNRNRQKITRRII